MPPVDWYLKGYQLKEQKKLLQQPRSCRKEPNRLAFVHPCWVCLVSMK